MAQDSLRRLAGELRRFIANQEEDEFILTAAPQRAADILPSASVQPAAQEALPKMPEGETLTVEFTRNPKSITPLRRLKFSRPPKPAKRPTAKSLYPGAL